AEADARGQARSRSQRYERVDGALVLFRELGLAGGWRRAAARRDVRVLGKVDRDEAARFALARQRHGVARTIRDEHRDSNLHRILSSDLPPGAFPVAVAQQARVE